MADEEAAPVDPAALPLSREGRPGSILDIADGHGIEIDHACGGVCAGCHSVMRKVKRGEQMGWCSAAAHSIVKVCGVCLRCARMEVWHEAPRNLVAAEIRKSAVLD